VKKYGKLKKLAAERAKKFRNISFKDDVTVMLLLAFPSYLASTGSTPQK
jgi:hypothetical protein